MNYTLIFCQASDGKFIVVEKDRPKWMTGRINLIGGKIEVGETPLQAARRELLEETGLNSPHDVSDLNELGQIVSNLNELEKVIDNNVVIHCFWTCTAFSSVVKLRPQDGETEKPYWIDWSFLRHNKKLMPNLRVIIPLMLVGQTDWVIEDDKYSLDKYRHKVSVTIPGGL